MTPAQTQELEALLARLCNADHRARLANMERANALSYVTSWVAKNVPAGTSEPLDIPAFLRPHHDAP